MRFGQQIRLIRTENRLTQEQMADRLHVTRQAVSNWENDRNLPDMEMLIRLAETFGLSLDTLLLEGESMNTLTEKLIRDGSRTRQAKMNLISVCIGAALLGLGALLLLIKAVSVEYVDPDGVLRENFFLLPVGFLFLFCGFITFLVTGIQNAVYALRTKDRRGVSPYLFGACVGVVLLLAGGFLALVAANSGANTALAGGILAGCGLVSLLLSVCLGVARRSRNSSDSGTD